MYVENDLILDKYLHSIIQDVNNKNYKNIINNKGEPSILKYYYKLKTKSKLQKEDKCCLIV